MCRINGIWSITSNQENPEEYGPMLGNRLRDSQAYGGPDDASYFFDAKEGLYLGHRRLSIIGPGESGRQPMENERFVLLFNGAIYNYKELRDQLTEYIFHSSTDTEVILAYWTKYGSECLRLFRGMFTIVLWDKQEKKLTFIRDRLGVKPLYYYFKDNLLIFGSELKAILEHPSVDFTIDRQAVSLFLQQGYIPAPDCILLYANKLPSGHIAEIRKDRSVSIKPYWSSIEQFHKITKVEKSLDQWTKEAEEVLTESFNLRMVADVPVGLFLSGGIDSSLLTALIQKDRSDRLNTFTIGFEDPRYDESAHARIISDHLGTKHHEFKLTGIDFEEIIQKLPYILDEPMGDSSIIPTYMVAQKASQEVKVCLSADGADELFGGYAKYEVTKNYYASLARIPIVIRYMLANMLSMIPIEFLERNQNFIPILRQYQGLEPKIHKLRKGLRAHSFVEFFNNVSTFISQDEAHKLCGIGINRIRSELNFTPDQHRMISYLGLLDVNTYLPGDILTKVDRATMHASLEGREPFLDQKLLEYSFSIPDNLKIRNKENKFLLRQILYKYVPREMIDRPKQGFAIPVDRWLRTLLLHDVKKMADDKNFLEYTGLSGEVISQHINVFLHRNKNPTIVWYFYILYRWYQTWIKA